jgi:hypothetical protein
MNKEIFAIGFNESITFAFVKPFYCSYCHNKYSPASDGECTSRKPGQCIPVFKLGLVSARNSWKELLKNATDQPSVYAYKIA